MLIMMVLMVMLPVLMMMVIVRLVMLQRWHCEVEVDWYHWKRHPRSALMTNQIDNQYLPLRLIMLHHRLLRPKPNIH
jgi:hypothetical protein